MSRAAQPWPRRTAPATPSSPVRRKLVGAVRAACARLGLGDDDRKAVQQRIIGKASMSDMSIAELGELLTHLNKDYTGPSGHNPHIGKVRALWWTLYWVGAIDDPGEAPLSAFVKRQTGITALRFLDARSSPSVIEALKSWAGRAGVNWPGEPGLARHRRYHNPDITMAQAERHAVVDALGDKLMAAGVIKVCVIEYLLAATGGTLNRYYWDAQHLDACIKLLGRRLRRAMQKPVPE